MTHGCSVCGFRSRQRAFVRRERSGFLGLPRRVCDGCEAYRPSAEDRRLVARFVGTQVFWLPVIAYAFEGGQLRGFSMIAALLVSFATMPLRVLIHELGHAWVGKLLGSQFITVVVGGGPRRRSLRLAGIRIDLHRNPVSGGRTVQLGPPPSRFRWREAAMLAAGPCANLASAALAMGLAYGVTASRLWGAQLVLGALTGFAVSSAWLGIFNLAPLKARGSSDVPTDGMKLLQLFGRPEVLTPDDETLVTTYVQSRAECFEDLAETALAAAPASPHATYLWSLGLNAVSRARGHQAAVDCYLSHADEIARATAAGGAEGKRSLAWIKGTVAWSALLSGDASLLELADEFSRFAADSAPDGAELRATRGAWLVAAEQPEAGVALLEGSIRGIADAQDKSDFCGVLARGWRELGHGPRAAAFEALQTHLLALRPA
jgi:hypothetical protein